MLQIFWRWFLKAKGWKIEGEIPIDLKKYIVVVAPHTTNWDFIMGLAVRSVMKMETRYLGKKELFSFPFGIIFRSLGGYPVDRSEHQNLVEEVTKIFDRHDKFSIAIAPEGTRKKVDRIKTGFYHIAEKANIPIILIAMDYERRMVIFSEPLIPRNEVEDMEKIHTFFRPIKGKYPELGLGHL